MQPRNQSAQERQIWSTGRRLGRRRPLGPHTCRSGRPGRLDGGSPWRRLAHAMGDTARPLRQTGNRTVRSGVVSPTSPVRYAVPALEPSGGSLQKDKRPPSGPTGVDAPSVGDSSEDAPATSVSHATTDVPTNLLRRRFRLQRYSEEELRLPNAAPEGMYDARQGAAAYAPIIGVFGSLAVPAIVVVFTINPRIVATQAAAIGLTVGLLVVGLVGSLLAAMGLAAIGAERHPTANLTAAIMLIAIPTTVSIAGILAAFQVLVSVYIPHSASLFAYIVAAGGGFGVLFNAFAVADSLYLGPTDPNYREKWILGQWIQSRQEAFRWAEGIAFGCNLPIIAGVMIRVFSDRPALTSTLSNFTVGVGIALILLGTAASIMQTAHTIIGNNQKSLRPLVAIGSNVAISGYILLLLIVMP